MAERRKAETPTKEIKSTGHPQASSSRLEMLVIIAVTTLTALYERGLNSGIPLHYDDLGMSATVGGTLVAAFTLASTVMRLLGGTLTDRFSHYRVLMASLVAMLVGALAPAICDNFTVVVISRIFQGAGFALGTNVMTVTVMGQASSAHIGRRVGLKGVGTSLGTMGGAVLATALLGTVGIEGFYLFYAAIMVVSLAAIFLWNRSQKRSHASLSWASADVSGKTLSKGHPAETPDAHIPEKHPGSAPSAPEVTVSKTNKASLSQRAAAIIRPYLNVRLAPYMAISFCTLIPKGFCVAFILIFAKEAHIAAGAAFFVVTGASTLLCRLLGGRLFDSPRTGLLFPIMLAEVIGFAALAVAPSLITLLIAGVGYGASMGLASPFLKTITAKATTREHWGVANGELFFFSDIGKALGSFAGGLAIDALGKAVIPQIALAIAVFAAIVTGAALLWAQRQHTR